MIKGKEYKTDIVIMNRNSEKFISNMLEKRGSEGWVLKQVVENPSMDEYIIIFERDCERC